MVRENPLRDELRLPVSNLKNVDSDHLLEWNIHLTFLRNNEKQRLKINFAGDAEFLRADFLSYERLNLPALGASSDRELRSIRRRNRCSLSFRCQNINNQARGNAAETHLLGEIVG